MLGFLLGLFFTALALILWTLQQTYSLVPAKELKRLARSGDEVAALLYRAAAYGISLRVLLGSAMIVSIVLALVFLISALDLWLAIILIVVVGGIGGFILVPSGELTRSSLWLAKHAAPGLGWLLERLQPVLGLLGRFIRKHRPLHIHTGLYDRTDLVELLERQKGQADSRIAPSEIALLQHSLTFGDKLVADALTPKRVVKMVANDESIGPVLLDELAKSGHSRFPVYSDKHDNIVGILYLHDLVGTKKAGRVDSFMSTKLTYVHEDFTLYQTLQAFLRTKQHLFLVVNSFEELVGIITIEDVIEQMIGRSIVDEFDRYDDLRAVAKAAAHEEHMKHAEPAPEVEAVIQPDTIAEPPEVVK